METDRPVQVFDEEAASRKFFFLAVFGHLLSGNKCREAVTMMANGIDVFLEKDEGPVDQAEVAFAFRMVLAYFTLFLERHHHLTPLTPPGPSVAPEEPLRCSFCRKNQNEVKKLIAGPKVFICNECVDICVEIISDDEQKILDEKQKKESPGVEVPL